MSDHIPHSVVVKRPEEVGGDISLTDVVVIKQETLIAFAEWWMMLGKTGDRILAEYVQAWIERQKDGMTVEESNKILFDWIQEQVKTNGMIIC